MMAHEVVSLSLSIYIYEYNGGMGVGGEAPYGPMGRERDHYRSYGLFMVSALFFSDFPGVLRLGRL